MLIYRHKKENININGEEKVSFEIKLYSLKFGKPKYLQLH